MWQRLKSALLLVLVTPLIAEYLLGSLTLAQFGLFPIMALSVWDRCAAGSGSGPPVRARLADHPDARNRLRRDRRRIGDAIVVQSELPWSAPARRRIHSGAGHRRSVDDLRYRPARGVEHRCAHRLGGSDFSGAANCGVAGEAWICHERCCFCLGRDVGELWHAKYRALHGLDGATDRNGDNRSVVVRAVAVASVSESKSGW